MDFKKLLADDIVQIITDKTTENERDEVGALVGAAVLVVFTDREQAHWMVDYVYDAYHTETTRKKGNGVQG